MILTKKFETTIADVKNWLEAAAMEYEEDDEDLHVTGGVDFPCFVRSIGSNRIVLTTYIETKARATREALLDLANLCNTKSMVPRFYVVSDEDGDNYFYANLTLFLVEPESKNLFLKMTREFTEDFAIAIRKYDADDITGGEGDSA